MGKNKTLDVTTLFAIAALVSKDDPRLFADFIKACILAAGPQHGWQQLQQRHGSGVYTNSNEHRLPI